jgi:hypothetical protein
MRLLASQTRISCGVPASLISGPALFLEYDEENFDFEAWLEENYP